MTPDLFKYFVAGLSGIVLLVALFASYMKKDVNKILYVLERFPSEEWFAEVKLAVNRTAEHTIAIAAINESLKRGRERMDRTDHDVVDLRVKVAALPKTNGANGSKS